MYRKVEVRRGDISHEIFVGNGFILLDIMTVYDNGKFIRSLVNR